MSYSESTELAYALVELPVEGGCIIDVGEELRGFRRLPLNDSRCPSCDDIEIDERATEAAAEQVVGEVADPWGQLGATVERTVRYLGCVST